MPGALHSDREVELLDHLPSMAGTFVKALVPTKKGIAEIPLHAVAVTSYAQDSARLAQYNRVCGFTLRDEVPSTWLHVLTFPLHVRLLGSSQSNIRLVGVVHVSNHIVQHRPVLATEALNITVNAANLRPHRRGALVDLVGQIRVANELVWEGTSTYLASGMRTPGEPRSADRDPFKEVSGHALWHLPLSLGKQYRAVSGDPNPIHTSRVAARTFGFKRPIIHGMWTHARGLAALEGRLPQAYDVMVDFARPILLPGSVGFTAVPHGAGFECVVTDRAGTKAHLTMSVKPL